VAFARAAPSDPPDFAGCFEAGQRPRLDEHRRGRPGRPTKASGVTGPATTGIQGDITSQVTGVTASSDNPPGETSAKAADGDVNSKWVDFHATGWINVTFREGAVRIVRETGKPIAQVARDLGVNEGTLGNWWARDRAARQGTDGLSVDDAAELKRLRSENAELRMERDVLKRSVVLWVKEATK